MSDVMQAVEAAVMQGEETDPVGAIVIGAVGLVLLSVTTIRRWRKRRGDETPPLHSFLDNAP